MMKIDILRNEYNILLTYILSLRNKRILSFIEYVHKKAVNIQWGKLILLAYHTHSG